MSDNAPQQARSIPVGQALQQALSLHQAGRLQDAAGIYRAILRDNPNQPVANHNLGALAVRAMRPGIALPHLKAALEAAPDQGQYWISYIDALLKTGATDAARQVLEQGRQRGLAGAAVDALAARLEWSAEAIAESDEHTWNPGQRFQPCGLTAVNRYPHIFSFVRERVPDGAGCRILSFGCSTGEEVFSLRRYFPQAEITGVDINPHSIAICRKKQEASGDARIRFALASGMDAEQGAGFDAVFCMLVLRHVELGGSHPDTCDHLIRFADFEQTVAGLCSSLKPGGYLVISGSNFRFSDTAAASGFDAVESLSDSTLRAITPLYGSDNQLLRDVVYDEVIFRKKDEA